MNISSTFNRWALGVSLALIVTGCASVTVKQGAEFAVPQMPQQIYVLGFSTTSGDWKVDRQGAELTDFQENLQLMLQTGIVTDITNHLSPTSAVNSTQALPSQNAWLIMGEFIRVNQGSRLLRATVGLGAGGTKLETVVHVYDLQAGYTSVPFLTFATTGGSGAMPGGVESLNPIGAALKTVAGAARGLTMDTSRTARMITAEISQYMYQNGFISKSQYMPPKSN